MIGVNVNKVPEPELSYSYSKFIPLSSARYARLWKCCGTILSMILLWISVFHCDIWIDEKIRKNRETWDKKEGHFYHEFRNALSLLQCPLPSPLPSQSFLDLNKSNLFFFLVPVPTLPYAEFDAFSLNIYLQYLVLRSMSVLITIPCKLLAYNKCVMNI